jgi:hypothetical protein
VPFVAGQPSLAEPAALRSEATAAVIVLPGTSCYEGAIPLRTTPSRHIAVAFQGREIAMSRRHRIYEGRAKVLFEGPGPGTLVQYFKDDATAFNNQRRGVITGGSRSRVRYQHAARADSEFDLSSSLL